MVRPWINIDMRIQYIDMYIDTKLRIKTNRVWDYHNNILAKGSISGMKIRHFVGFLVLPPMVSNIMWLVHLRNAIGFCHASQKKNTCRTRTQDLMALSPPHPCWLH